jgi:hypothetical protein
MPPIALTCGTGLKVPSIGRFDKLATLERSVIAGKVSDAPPAWPHAQRATFFSVASVRLRRAKPLVPDGSRLGLAGPSRALCRRLMLQNANQKVAEVLDRHPDQLDGLSSARATTDAEVRRQSGLVGLSKDTWEAQRWTEASSILADARQ